MFMSGGNVRQLRRRGGMAAIDPAIIGAAAGALQSGADPGAMSMPGSGGSGTGVNVPVTTQVTTAVSPVFNISAGNSGGGGVTQSGSTSQSTTPTSSNVIGQPMPGQPGGGYDPYASGTLPGSAGAYDPYSGSGLVPTTDTSYQYDSSKALYPQPAMGGGSNMKTLLLLAAAAAVVYIILQKKGSTGGSTSRVTVNAPRKTRKRGK